MRVREARTEDIDRIIDIYAIAKQYMDANGNETQWKAGYPGRKVIEDDIAKGWAYVCVDKDVIHGVFEFFQSPDPAYQEIEGAWRNDRPYGTIHRVAGSGEAKGVFETAVNYAKERCDNVRMDTHRNNHTMQHLLKKHGFERCGTIHLEDGEERWAYQYTRS